MLLRVQLRSGLGLPPTGGDDTEMESFLLKIGGGLGVPGLWAGYLTVKRGLLDVNEAWRGKSETLKGGSPRRGVPSGMGLGFGGGTLHVACNAC